MKAPYATLALAAALSTAAACQSGSQDGSQGETGHYAEETVFKNSDIEIHQIDQHTWHGNGHLVYNESVYLIEGDSAALLIDAGTTIPGLKKIAESIVKKPVILAATHVHPDHTGSAIGDWDSIWICEPDTINIPSAMPQYQGKLLFLKEGQTFQLGNREIEVMLTPGHTPGSATFIDKQARYGFSGDSFGSSNLLVTTTLSDVVQSCAKMAQCMESCQIDKLYPGHYAGDNPETLQRVKDVAEISSGILSGKYSPETSIAQRAIEMAAAMIDTIHVYALPNVVEDRGVRINYGQRQLR